MRQIFLDTETTGLNPDQGDRLLEIGCVELLDRRPSGANLHHYVNPQRSSHPDALRVHGITDEFLADKPLFADIVDELLAYLAGAEVVIHNAAFDIGFIDAELARLGRGRLADHVASITDSLVLARETYPGKSNSLDALCKRLEVDNSRRDLHGALLDAGLLAEVYLRMTRGQESLVIEGEAPSQGPLGDEQAPDLSSIALPVLQASDEEQQAHQALLAEIDKASGGKTVWRALEAAEAVA